MANKIVFGGPPPADVTDFPPGSVWAQIEQDLTSDPNGLTFIATVWSATAVNQIYWGDGDVNGYNTDPDFDTPPASDGELGVTTVNHTYTGRPGTMYRIMIEAGGGNAVRIWAQVQAGEPDIIDDVTSQGITRPHDPDLQPSVFAERRKMLASTREQMRTYSRVTNPRGGMVNR
jgi:hypothetical protein